MADKGLEARMARVAKIAAEAARNGESVTLGPATDIAELERHFGLDGSARSAAEPPPATVLRGDSRAFLKHLDAIAAGTVRVVNG